MTSLQEKRILLGITGGIAAYKSADLVRRLRERGAEVQVVMTRGAQEFVTPLTFQALSGRPVCTRLLDHDAESGMGHISLARWCDLVLVAPASANFIARLAQGIADDLLTTLSLATAAPVMVAPAMNRQMWEHPATRENYQLLQARGIVGLDPAEGSQACGETGPGRMLEPAELVDAVIRHFSTGVLAGRRVLITAGPTREPIDPVRYISNRSSGRMGYALARAAREAGAAVTLVSGPVMLQAPEGVNCLNVSTAAQMQDQVLNAIGNIDIFIAAAAVADYRCRTVADSKIKKDQATMVLELERNPDILATVAGLNPGPYTVGFAAETGNLEEAARTKLHAKRLDMIAANLVGESLGFETDDNALEIYWPGGHISLPRTSKERLARQLITLIADRYHEKNPD